MHANVKNIQTKEKFVVCDYLKTSAHTAIILAVKVRRNMSRTRMFIPVAPCGVWRMEIRKQQNQHRYEGIEQG